MRKCRYFSGAPAEGLPTLPRPDGTTRPDFESRLLGGSTVEAQYYQQYVRPATTRAFKQMQVSIILCNLTVDCSSLHLIT